MTTVIDIRDQFLAVVSEENGKAFVLTGDNELEARRQAQIASQAASDATGLVGAASTALQPGDPVSGLSETDDAKVMTGTERTKVAEYAASFSQSELTDASFENAYRLVATTAGQVLEAYWPDGTYKTLSDDVRMVDLTGTAWEGALLIKANASGQVIEAHYDDGRIVSTQVAATSETAVATFVSAFAMPDSAYPNPNGGFTCTGLDEIGAAGAYAGCWLVASDGRTEESSSTHHSAILLLTPDRLRVLSEFDLTADLSGVQSIQGLCWDSSDDTIWFVDKRQSNPTTAAIRHMGFDGAQISADTILITDIEASPSWKLNGIAYHPGDHALWIAREGVARIDLWDIAAGSITRSITTSAVRTDIDQLGYDEARDWLYASYGDNGTNGRLLILDATSGEALADLELELSQSIEGVKFSAFSDRLIVVNDGAFHTTAKPPLALSCEYLVEGVS